jgi:hypothetical protein
VVDKRCTRASGGGLGEQEEVAPERAFGVRRA